MRNIHTVVTENGILRGTMIHRERRNGVMVSPHELMYYNGKKLAPFKILALKLIAK